MGDVLFIVFAIFSLALLAASCGPHFRAGNVGAISLVGWCTAITLVSLINHIIYFDSYEDRTPVWCDIVVKIQSTVQTGLAASCLCINRRLAIISSSKRVNGGGSKRLAFWVDVAIVTIPSAWVMLVSYFVQGHRYNITEEFGCISATYWEVEAILGLLVLPLMLSLISFGYGGLSVYNFTSQRRRFQSLLQQNSSSLNSSRFLRLLTVSAVDMLLSTPFIAWNIAYQARHVRPSQRWSDLHYDFDLVFLNAKVDEDSSADAFALHYSFLISLWLPNIAAFVYFVCFGMHDSALESYMALYQNVSHRVARLLGRSQAGTALSLPTLGTTVTSPSEEHWARGKDPKVAEEDDLPFAFEERERVGALKGKCSWDGGIHVKVERDVA